MTQHDLKEGDPAPGIKLADDKGDSFDLANLKGKNVVLYFYPKADTPGCTKESCEFRDSTSRFTADNTVIVGVSPDKSAAQSKFKSQIRSAVHATGGHRTHHRRSLRGLERKKHVREEVYGNRAHHFPDRPGRAHKENLFEGKA